MTISSTYNIVKTNKRLQELEERNKNARQRIADINLNPNPTFLPFNIKDDPLNEDAEIVLSTMQKIDTQNIELLKRNDLYNDDVRLAYQNIKNHTDNPYEVVKSIFVYTENILSNLDSRYNP